MNPLQTNKKPRDSAYDRALSLLARREHSRQELSQKLERKEFEQNEIRDALEKLVGEGYLSNQRFAEMLVRSRISQSYGPVRIRAELRRHELDESLIDNVLGKAEQDVDWSDVAVRLVRRHYGDQGATDFAERAKRAQFLLRRGFPADIASRAAAWSD